MKLNRKIFREIPACLTILFFLCAGFHTGVCHSAASKGKEASSDVNYWLKELKNRKPVAGSTAAGVRVAKNEAAGVRNISPGEASIDPEKVKAARLTKGPKKISVDLYKVDLHNVFRLLGQVSGKNVVVDEGVKGTVTLALDNVPWTFVLEVIKNLKGLDSIERNNTIMVYPRKKSIQWAGETGAEGTLDTKPAVVEVSRGGTNKISKRGKRISIEQKRKSHTPLKQIIQAEKLIKKAASQEKHGNILGAYENLKKAANLWPDNLELDKKLAAIALQQDDPLAALNYAKEALKVDSKDGEAAAVAAVALARLDRVKDAKAYFEMAISKKAARDTLWNYAVFSFSQGDYRRALRLLNRTEANYKVDPDIIMLKAQCYEYLAKTPQAITEYKTILSAGPAVPEDMISFAQLRLKALTGSGYAGQ